MLGHRDSDKDTDIYVDGEYLLTAKSSKSAMIKISKQSPQGRQLSQAFNEEQDVELRQ